MPVTGSTVAAFGTGGLGSGVLGWAPRYLFASGGNNVCQNLVQEAVETAQRHCEQACLVEPAPSDWLHLVEKLSPDNFKYLLVGIVVCFSLFIFIDVLYVVKEWWRARVHFWVRSWVLRPHNTYALPLHAAR